MTGSQAAPIPSLFHVGQATDLRERIVRPGVRSVTRDVFAQFNAKDAITKAGGSVEELALMVHKPEAAAKAHAGKGVKA